MKKLMERTALVFTVLLLALLALFSCGGAAAAKTRPGVLPGESGGGAVIEFLISLLGVGLMISIIGCGLYLVMRWDDGSEAMDAKARNHAEERKNARIAAELKARRKGGEE